MTPQSIEAVSTHSSILVFTVFALGVEDRVHAGVVTIVTYPRVALRAHPRPFWGQPGLARACRSPS